jgi:creatinine amidohydrolase
MSAATAPTPGTARPMATRRLDELSSERAAELIGEDSVLILPVGAVEQHGPHLPLATDLIVVSACADAVVAEHGDELDLWALPPLPFSKSNEHAWAPGTLWLTPETVLATMRDLGRSLATLAARKLVLLNGHGGNTSLLDVVCRELRLEHGFQTFLLHASLPPDHGGEGAPEEHGLGIHGGVGETSVMLHLRPDLVDMDLAVRNVPLWLESNRHVRFGGSASFGVLSHDFGPRGVIGDATIASAAAGTRSFEAGVAFLGEVLGEVARFDFPDRPRRPVGADPT